ncbi:response regulator NasT [Vibrio maritimus]|uniref:Response regulator NasT n=1 Tax=Vibrio maritimus TaxID=990268 RepID=A0A090S5T8_9VIBR|nr:response regulator NasT [Vibrio maritimus]
MPKTPVLVCCDSIAEQAHISARLAKDFDKIMGCQLSQLESMLEKEPTATLVISWQQPCAELSLIMDAAKQRQRPLLVILKQLNENDINRLPVGNDYVLLPHDSQFELSAWVVHARQVREKSIQDDQKLEALNLKLEERKLIEKAKGLLMKHHHLDEQAAFSALRKSSMQSSLSLAQVSKNLIHTLESISL